MLLTGPPLGARNGGFDWPSSKAEKSRCLESHAARHPSKPTMDGVQQRGTAPCVLISFYFIYLFILAQGGVRAMRQVRGQIEKVEWQRQTGGKQKGPYSRAAVLDGFWATACQGQGSTPSQAPGTV